MNDKDIGYFTLQRALLEHEIWTDEPFNKGAAWVDLIGRANYKKSEKMIGATLVKIPRGQLVTSIRALSRRWSWSQKKVKRFLKTLEDAQMVSVKGTSKGTYITICNYNVYQLSGDSEGTTKGLTKEALRKREGSTKEALRDDTIKKDKKENKENKENNTLPPASRTFIGADGEEYEEVDHL